MVGKHKFLVFTHVTFALTTVAIRHVGAQTNSLIDKYNSKAPENTNFIFLLDIYALHSLHL